MKKRKVKRFKVATLVFEEEEVLRDSVVKATRNWKKKRSPGSVLRMLRAIDALERFEQETE